MRTSRNRIEWTDDTKRANGPTSRTASRRMSEWYYVEPVFVDPDGWGYDVSEDSVSPDPRRLDPADQRVDGSDEPATVYVEWCPGDDFVQSHRGFLISDVLKEVLVERELTGYEIAPIHVAKEAEFERDSPDVTPPAYHLLIVTGTGYRDDVGLGTAYAESMVASGYGTELVLSGEALDCFLTSDLSNAHYMERLDERDILEPDAGLEDAIRDAFDDPTERAVERVSTLSTDRSLDDDADSRATVARLSNLLSWKTDTDDVVRWLEASEGPSPAEADAVDRLVELVADRACEEGARAAFDDPTVETVRHVITVATNRHGDEAADASGTMDRLSDLLAGETDIEDVVQVLEAYDGDPPAEGHAAERLVALVEERS